jgi:hypothetical protein
MRIKKRTSGQNARLALKTAVGMVAADTAPSNDKSLDYILTVADVIFDDLESKQSKLREPRT